MAKCNVNVNSIRFAVIFGTSCHWHQQLPFRRSNIPPTLFGQTCIDYFFALIEKKTHKKLDGFAHCTYVMAIAVEPNKKKKKLTLYRVCWVFFIYIYMYSVCVSGFSHSE